LSARKGSTLLEIEKAWKEKALLSRKQEGGDKEMTYRSIEE
jgi:hypothetical protein